MTMTKRQGERIGMGILIMTAGLTAMLIYMLGSAILNKANAGGFGNASATSNAGAIATGGDVTARLNARQLNRMGQGQGQGQKNGNNDISIKGDKGDDMFTSLGFGVAYSANVGPSGESYKGVKTWGATSIFGGIQIPQEVDDTTKAYKHLAKQIVIAWAACPPGNEKQCQLLRALQCEMIEGVEDSIESIGMACPSSGGGYSSPASISGSKATDAGTLRKADYPS